MSNYQLRVENDDYTLLAWLKDYKSLKYRQVLNGVGYCEIEMHPDDSKIDDIALMKRLKLIRDGTVVFGGLIQRINWQIPQAAPQGEMWKFYARDHAEYATWRLCLPTGGNAYEEEGPDDSADVLKDFVYMNMGLGAAVARRFSDLTIAADNHDGDSITAQSRYGILHNVLQTLAGIHDLDWRFYPGASGCTFDCKALWGLDRTQGNGVNDECVFTKDRHNFLSMAYTKDATAHFNYVYVGGQGEGTDRAIVERSTAGDITTYKRRERFIDARQLSVTASLQERGDAALTELQAIESMNVLPTTETWKASSGTTWDLGDQVTVYVHEYGRDFSYDGKIVGLDVTLTSGELEKAVPILEAV